MHLWGGVLVAAGRAFQLSHLFGMLSSPYKGRSCVVSTPEDGSFHHGASAPRSLSISGSCWGEGKMEPEIDSLVQHQQYCTRTLYQKCNAKTITLERPVPWKSGPPEARQSSINKLDSHLEFQPSGIFVCICTCFLLLLSSALFVK